MVSYSLIFRVVRSFLVFSGFGLKSPASGFQFYSSIVSRLLQLQSTDNKTSRLMVKRFSTVRDNQRGSQSQMKNRRGRKEIEVSRRRESGTREERDRSTQLSVSKVFSIAQTPTEIHRIGLERERERRKQRCSEVDNRESKVGESNQHTPEQKWELNIGFLNVQNLYHILKNKD